MLFVTSIKHFFLQPISSDLQLLLLGLLLRVGPLHELLRGGRTGDQHGRAADAVADPAGLGSSNKQQQQQQQQVLEGTAVLPPLLEQ